MRFQLLAAGFLLASGILSVASAATVTMSPPPAELQPQPKTQPAAKSKAQSEVQPIVQPQARPKVQAKAQSKAQSEARRRARPEIQAKAQPRLQARVTCPCDCPDGRKVRGHAAARHAPYRIVRHAARNYAENGYYHYASAAPIPREWHRHWMVAPNNVYIRGPQEGLRIDQRGWTGGVGNAPDGGGGFVDGYGLVHFANGGGAENGPTYNNYNQSSQFNPSQAGSFQPRLMGRIAPSSK
jgi:hypothetical protein